MRALPLLLLAALAGCSPQPVIALAAADLATVTVFGRGIVDLGVSAISGRDCSIVRLDKGLSYCAPIEGPPPIPLLHPFPGPRGLLGQPVPPDPGPPRAWPTPRSAPARRTAIAPPAGPSPSPRSKTSLHPARLTIEGTIRPPNRCNQDRSIQERTTMNAARRFVLTAAIAAMAASPAFAQRKDPGVSGPVSGTVSMTAQGAAAGIGYTWGDGNLRFGGRTYRFSVSGVHRRGRRLFQGSRHWPGVQPAPPAGLQRDLRRRHGRGDPRQRHRRPGP